MSLPARLRKARSIRRRYMTQGLQHQGSAREHMLAVTSIRDGTQGHVAVKLTYR